MPLSSTQEATSKDKKDVNAAAKPEKKRRLYDALKYQTAL
jgi:hypothetical protein